LQLIEQKHIYRQHTRYLKSNLKIIRTPLSYLRKPSPFPAIPATLKWFFPLFALYCLILIFSLFSLALILKIYSTLLAIATTYFKNQEWVKSIAAHKEIVKFCKQVQRPDLESLSLSTIGDCPPLLPSSVLFLIHLQVL
jgi:hypothetical protein